jgi:hypothetical protein
MPTTQYLSERLWAHLSTTNRLTPEDPLAVPIEEIAALVTANDMPAAEALFRAWVEHILVNILGMGLEFKMMALFSKLQQAIMHKNSAIWTEGDAEKTRTDISDTLLAIVTIDELKNYNEEGEWVGPSGP